MLSVRDPIRRRQPVERPLDIVALELLVSVSQSLLAGILLSLAARLGGDVRAQGLPIPGLLAVLGIAVGVGWLRWLMGGSGWLMASVSLAIAILAGALWLLALQDATLPRIDPLVGLITVACAIYGFVAGVFLDGPHRAHWKGGISEPHRGLPQTRATPARFSPPVQKVVDERLADLHLPHVTLPSAPRLALPTVKRGSDAASAVPAPGVGDGLAPAEPVVPQAPASQSKPAVVVLETPVPALATPAPAPAEPVPAPAEPAPTQAASVPALATPAPGPGLEATEVVVISPADRPSGATAESAAATEVVDPTSADPDAPTQPEARAAAQWPRPIEPRGHTGGHTSDPSG